MIAQQEIDLNRYWLVLRRRKWSVLLLAFLVTLLATLIVYSLTPFYSATAKLQVEPEVQKSISVESLVRLESNSQEYYLTQLEILKSRRLSKQVIVELKLDKDADFLDNGKKNSFSFSSLKKILLATFMVGKVAPSPFEGAIMDVLIDKLQGGLYVTMIKGTQLIKITYQSKSPRLAELVPNALANAYIKDLLASRIEKTRLTTSWLEKRLLILQENLLASDKSLQAYREKHGLIDVRGVNTLTANELKKLTMELLLARSEFNKLSETYGSKHPKYIAGLSELKAAKRGLASGKVKIQGIARKSVKLRELQRQVESNRELYATFLNRLNKINQYVESQSVNARVSDFAVFPIVPFKPKKGVTITLVFFVSLLFGVLLVFLYDSLDKTFKNTGDIEDKLDVPILGLLPLIKENKQRKEQVFAILDPKQSSFAEYMRTIRTGLVLSSLDNPHKVILVTSSLPGEGKTVVSTNLAVAMAQMEKVLLIGADLRRPTLSRAIGLQDHKLGISSIVAGTADFKDCIRHIDVAGIDVLPCGQVPPNPLELLSSERFAKMLAVLENHYDRIVIDSPPVQAVSDALVLSKYAKAVVYVIEADSTHEHAVMNGINRLLEHGAPLAGVILNKFDVSEGAKYDYNSGGYYDLYGYSESTT